MQKTVSIIVPVFKVEKYLDRCLDSLTAQTYTELEILLVDDGSPDRCPELCDLWARRDSRIRVIHQENAGVAAARNTGLDAACGDYIMFVDSDDYMPADAVQTLLERLTTDGSDMAVGKIVKDFEDGHTDGRYWDFLRDRKITGEELLCGQDGGEQSLVNVYGKLYSRKALDGIRFPQMTCGEDMWVFPLIALQCEIVSTVDHLVYCYFQRPDSVIHSKTDRQNMEAVRSSLHMVEVYHQTGHSDCASRWLGIAIQYVQELEEKRPGIGLIESVFPEREIRLLLRSCKIVNRAKWFLLHHPGLYNAIFGLKRTVTRLLRR